MLSCSCDFDGEEWYYPPNDFVVFQHTRRKRCCSCKELIDQGAQCLEFSRGREPVTEIEESICGDEVGLASWFMCEKCGEMYFNLEAIGYCHNLGHSIFEDLKEYHELTGFKKETKCQLK